MLAVDIDEDSDEEEADDKVRAAVADEGEGHALVWKEGGGDADIDDRLEGDHEDGTHREEESEPVAGADGDEAARESEKQKTENDGEGEAKAEFLADHGKNEIGMGVGEVKHFLTTFAEAEAVDATRAECDEGLPLLEAFGEAEFLGFEEGEETAHALGDEHGDGDKAAAREADDRDEKQETGARQEHEAEGDGTNEGRAAEINLRSDERKKDADDETREDKALPEVGALGIVFGEPPGDEKDRGHLGQFAWLEGHEAEIEPAPGTIDSHADGGDEAENKQESGSGEPDPPGALPPVIIHHGCDNANAGSDNHPKGLAFDKVEHVAAAVLCKGTGAEEHDDADGDKAKHADQQDIDGVTIHGVWVAGDSGS